MVEGHSIWHFQTDDKEGNPKAVRVPANPRGEIADRAFYAAPSIRHVEVATGIQHTGIAAWQSCQQSQIVKLPTSVVSLAEGTFMGCYVLRQVAAPGCVHCGQRVFAECCSLGSVGVSDIGDRAFCGCEQLQRFTLLDWRDVEQWVQAEHNAFLCATNLKNLVGWELLPAEGPDSDAFDEELNHVYPWHYARP